MSLAVDQRSADLCDAKFDKDSKFSGVDLSDAALEGVSDVTIDRLEREAESLHGAMINGLTYEELKSKSGEEDGGARATPRP